MPMRLIAGATALAVAVTGALLSDESSAQTSPQSSAGRAPDVPEAQHWTEADKTGFGTARTTGSNVWFTLQDGLVSEVFYPDLSTPSVRSLELVVSGEEFTDRASKDMRTTMTRPDPESLRFTQVSTDPDGHYELTVDYVTDPRHDTLLAKVRLEALDDGHYWLTARYRSALDNGGDGDRRDGRHDALWARDGKVASALLARPAVRTASIGADVLEASLPPSTTIALGFGTSIRKAMKQARGSLRAGFTQTRTAYDEGWHRYLDGLEDVPASAAGIEREYAASALVLAAAEDKQHRGAFVASPSAPWVWGDEVEGLSSPSGAYHLVWSRDSYQFGTALWAMGDRAAARRTVRWLFGTQQRKDGSFPQNSDVAGTPVWGELQLDEVALPIALAHLTGMDDARTWRGVRKAAEFLVGFKDEETGRRAPYSPQERWENQAGYSPNSIATQVVGLVCAADIARRNGAGRLARQWLDVADRWQRKVKDWTVTTNGPLSDDPYFLRLTKNGKPDTASPYEMGDGGPRSIDQRTVVDPSYLDLARLGVLPVDDPAIVNTLAVVDAELKVDTPNGPFWRRFTRDGYGETRDGGQWTITDPGTHTTLGRGWPILTGERGEYAVAAGEDASSYLAAMAAAAGPTDLISEQVWDNRPPTGDPCCAAGENTRAATPLTWSHAGLVRLAWTIQNGAPVDQPALVAERYLR